MPREAYLNDSDGMPAKVILRSLPQVPEEVYMLTAAASGSLCSTLLPGGVPL